jgi:hypothetical protein
VLEAASVAAQRQALRDRTRSARLALDPQARASATAAACARAIAALAEVDGRARPWRSSGRCAASWIPRRSPPRSTPAAHALAYPVVVGPGEPLRFHRAAPAELVDAAWGLREPAAVCAGGRPGHAGGAGGARPGLRPPRQSPRLGQGLLRSHVGALRRRAPRVVAFEHQLVDDSALDPRPHDLPVHFDRDRGRAARGRPRAPRGTPS